MYLAWRNLLQDRVRFGLSVLGVALAVMLILFLLGLRAGVFRAAVAYLDHTPGAVALLPRGARSTGASSGRYLPPGTAATAAQIEGVARVTPILLIAAIPQFHGRKEAIRLLGYDPALGGGPWRLAGGREPAADDEVVLDRVLARRHNFDLGDSLEFGGRRWQVVGLSRGTSSWTGSYIFARASAVEALTLAPGAASLILVTPTPETRPAALRERLQALPGTSALLKTEVMANDRQIVAGIADQVILLMVGAAFIVGALVVSMVIYTATIERQGEYGILKAIGARNGALYRVVVGQALAAAGLGVALGVGLAFAGGWLVMTAKPQFSVVIEPAAIAATLAAGLIMAVAGGLAPGWAVARLAPADVFRR